ncbi:MAG: bifunctional DNA-binding transcriptional regulator/O6-methylguanine-DNA methyltransferase Ada [Sulfuritalea sp.]|nr:bifunctional DNA-binding transcriptional regulator/O6-methylguanine-DNA methyltransferase Ada [Sulfuritalea sp.]
MASLDNEACWRAVVNRDTSADNAFFYAVKTTGIFCRPSCSARRPLRKNVAFYATAQDAEMAGFRPCLRCRPLAAIGTDVATATMIDLSHYLEIHADESISLAPLAKHAGLSPHHLQRSFKGVIGVSPKEFQTAARLKRLKKSLRTGGAITGAVFDAGFGSTSRAYEHVDGRLGMTPSAYRAGGAGETLSYACRKTTLGLIMMAGTARGVCFVQFGDSESALLEQLKREYPRATVLASSTEVSPLLDAWIAALDEHLSAGNPSPDLPLDLRGTAFQIRVWRFLMRIREGEVMSYTDVAKGIGQPKAARAAASAIAANRIAILIPCHRVLRGDGSLGGYRWGVDRKRALIDTERRRRAEKPAA